MDAVHIHLALNHLAIYGVFIGTLIYLYGLLKKNTTVINIALVMYVLLAIISIPVFLTGHDAEEAVEDLVVGAHRVIHPHEELAETAIWVMYALGLISILNLYRMRRTKEMNMLMNWSNLLVGVATSVLFLIVGNLGGQIRHSEIRTMKTEQRIEQGMDDDDEDVAEHEHETHQDTEEED